MFPKQHGPIPSFESVCTLSLATILLTVSLGAAPPSSGDVEPSDATATWPPIEALATTDRERTLLRAESLDWPLLETGLIACGIQGQMELQRFRRIYDERRREMRLPSPQCGEEQAAARILEELHRTLLTGEYRAECSDLCATLSTGDYNCVTATLLYLCMAADAGREAVAVSAPGHVYNRHYQDDLAIDVQSTSRWWFVNEGRGQLQPDASEANRRVSQARELSGRALIGKFYYNRGVLALRAGQYPEALRVLRISAHLDPEDGTGAQQSLGGIEQLGAGLL